MSKKKLSYIGITYGNVTVEKELPPKVYPDGHEERVFLCRCVCGNPVEITHSNLLGKGRKNCGCVVKNKKLLKCKKTGQEHGLTYISGFNGTCNDKVLWECARGHQFKRALSYLKRNGECPYCNGNKLSKELIEYKLRGRNITWLGPLGRAHDKTKWQCAEGHVWEATPANVLNLRSACPLCGRKHKRTSLDNI